MINNFTRTSSYAFGVVLLYLVMFLSTRFGLIFKNTIEISYIFGFVGTAWLIGSIYLKIKEKKYNSNLPIDKGQFHQNFLVNRGYELLYALGEHEGIITKSYTLNVIHNGDAYINFEQEDSEILRTVFLSANNIAKSDKQWQQFLFNIMN